MAGDFSRRDVNTLAASLAAGLAAWLAVGSEATAKQRPKAATDLLPWQEFQKHSKIEAVYSGKDGTYVIIRPKDYDEKNPVNHSSAWWDTLGVDKSLSGFIERNSDNVGAVFFMRDGKEPLMAQNIVGFNTVFDVDYDAPRAKPDDEVPLRYPELAERNEGYEVLNLLGVRNVLTQYDYDINPYEGEPVVDIAKAAHSLSFNARDAFATCADGSEKKFLRDVKKEQELKAKLAKLELQLANLIPDGLAFHRGSFLDKSSGNIYVVTQNVTDGKLLVNVVGVDDKASSAQELIVANPARGVLEEGRTVGYTNFYKTANGLFINFYGAGDNFTVGTLGPIDMKNKPRLTLLAADDPMLKRIVGIKLLSGDKEIKVVSHGAIKGNPAVVELPNACSGPVRDVKSLESRGWESRHSNNGG